LERNHCAAHDLDRASRTRRRRLPSLQRFFSRSAFAIWSSANRTRWSSSIIAGTCRREAGSAAIAFSAALNASRASARRPACCKISPRRASQVFLARKLFREPVQAGQRHVEVFLFQLDIQRVKLERDERAKFFDPFFQAPQRLLQVRAAFSGQDLRAFEIQLRPRVGGQSDGPGVILRGQEGLLEFTNTRARVTRASTSFVWRLR